MHKYVFDLCRFEPRYDNLSNSVAYSKSLLRFRLRLLEKKSTSMTNRTVIHFGIDKFRTKMID